MGRVVRVVIQAPSSFKRISLPAPLSIVSETPTLSETLAATERWRPQVILHVIPSDHGAPGMEASFLARQTGVPVVCVLLDGTPQSMRDALVAGAAQALMWPQEAADLPAALLEASGRVALPHVPSSTLSIAVYGAKGGVGATRVATELALAFRHIGQPVLLADLGSGDSGPLSLLGLAADRGLADLAAVADELTIDQVQKVAVQHASGTLLAGSGRTTLPLDAVRSVVFACRHLLPVTIWDIPSEGFHQLASADSAFTHILCVTTADAHAVAVLKRRALANWGSRLLSRVQLVVNRRTADSLLRSPDIAAQLQMPLAAEVDERPGLAAASGTAATAITVGARRQPNRTAQQIERLARGLCPQGSVK